MPPGTQRSRLVVSLSRERYSRLAEADSKDVLKLSRGTGKFFFTTQQRYRLRSRCNCLHYVTAKW